MLQALNIHNNSAFSYCLSILFMYDIIVYDIGTGDIYNGSVCYGSKGSVYRIELITVCM